MDGFTVFDLGVAMVIVVSALLAYARGLVREMLAIGSWIGAGLLAFALAPFAQPLVREVPYLDKLVGDSCELSLMAAYSGVFAVSLIMASLFTPLISSVVRESALGGLDQGMGFLFGALRGFLLIAVTLLVYDRVFPAGSVLPAIDHSRSVKVFASMSENIGRAVQNDAPGWLVNRYGGLTASCTRPGLG